MSKPILVGYDPRQADDAPVEFGAAAARFTGAPLIVATVDAGHHARHDHRTGHIDDDLVADSATAVESVEARLKDAGVAVECRRLQSSSAARALHEAAEESGAALLVVGASRRSAAGRAVVGSTGVRLLHGAPCAVAVAPRDWTPKERLDTIGVAYVDSDEGREALRSAHALAGRAGAKLKVFTVVKTTASTHLETDARQASWEHERKDMIDVEGGHLVVAEEHLRDVIADLGGDVAVEAEAFNGHPADEIVRLSGLVDLMVVGSRGYGPRRAVLLGSVSRRLMDEAASPTLVLPRGVEGALESLLAESGPAGVAA
jgi:nucleotide-binding universal stress UspA family protein